MEEKTPQNINSAEMQMLVAGILPNTRCFDSRFDLLQVQIDELCRNQDVIRENIGEFKHDVDRRFNEVDRRFEQVDKRFEQVDKRFDNFEKRLDWIVSSIDRLSDKLDNRDVHQRNFTLRMFSIAIAVSILGVMGVFSKSLIYFNYGPAVKKRSSVLLLF